MQPAGASSADGRALEGEGHAWMGAGADPPAGGMRERENARARAFRWWMTDRLELGAWRLCATAHWPKGEQIAKRARHQTSHISCPPSQPRPPRPFCMQTLAKYMLLFIHRQRYLGGIQLPKSKYWVGTTPIGCAAPLRYALQFHYTLLYRTLLPIGIESVLIAVALFAHSRQPPPPPQKRRYKLADLIKARRVREGESPQERLLRLQLEAVNASQADYGDEEDIEAPPETMSGAGSQTATPPAASASHTPSNPSTFREAKESTAGSMKQKRISFADLQPPSESATFRLGGVAAPPQSPLNGTRCDDVGVRAAPPAAADDNATRGAPPCAVTAAAVSPAPSRALAVVVRVSPRRPASRSCDCAKAYHGAVLSSSSAEL